MGDHGDVVDLAGSSEKDKVTGPRFGQIDPSALFGLCCAIGWHAVVVVAEGIVDQT